MVGRQNKYDTHKINGIQHYNYLFGIRAPLHKLASFFLFDVHMKKGGKTLLITVNSWNDKSVNEILCFFLRVFFFFFGPSFRASNLKKPEKSE